MWVSTADSDEGKASRFSRFYTCGVKTSAAIGYESDMYRVLQGGCVEREKLLPTGMEPRFHSCEMYRLSVVLRHHGSI